MLNKLWPSRQDAKSKQPSVMVADLDSLLVEDVKFKLLGRVHTIRPFTVEQFARFSRAYYDLVQLSIEDLVSPDDLASSYKKLTDVIGLTLTEDDYKKMSQQQAAALFQILADVHTGRIFGDEKKTQEKVQTLLSIR